MSEKSEDSRQEIMEATYAALCKHGYSELSIQKIADEFDRGKSLIYYHFDDKDDLMVSFLEHLIDRMKQDLLECDCGEPDEKLDAMLDEILAINDEEMWGFRRALMEMRAQAPHSQKFAEKFREIDRLLKQKFAELLRQKDVSEPDQQAELLLSTVDGVMNRKAGYGKREDLEQLKDRIKEIYTD